MTKPKLRRGIGWQGRVFQYSTATSPEGAVLSTHGPVEGREEITRTLNKLPEFKRAAKKRQRLDDMRTQDL